MAEMTCPVCGGSMSETKEPDVTIDVCGGCGATFVNKGELNSLATGMAGNIEYLSVDDVQHDDRFPNRTCPHCGDTEMRKAELLGHTGIVFDFCPTCEGFLLDKNELPRMNEVLSTLTGRDVPDEYRGEVDGYTVRMDRVGEVVASFYPDAVTVRPQQAFHVRFSVYFKRPLGGGIRIHSEKWTERLAKLFGIGHKEDIETGNQHLDKLVIVQADDASAARDLLKHGSVAGALISFVESRPRLFSFPLQMEILDEGIVCSGGPYPERLSYDISSDDEGVVGQMVALAKAFDNRP